VNKILYRPLSDLNHDLHDSSGKNRLFLAKLYFGLLAKFFLGLFGQTLLPPFWPNFTSAFWPNFTWAIFGKKL